MRLQVLDLDAGRVAAGSPRRLTHHGVSIPFLAWTRDGASIVYSANEEPYFFHLCGHRECGEVTSARPFFFTAGMNA